MSTYFKRFINNSIWNLMHVLTQNIAVTAIVFLSITCSYTILWTM